MFRNTVRLSAACLFSLLLLQAPHAFAYKLDTANHVLSVSPSTNASTNTTELNNAFNYLVNRSDKTTKWTMNFASGNYPLAKQVRVSNLQNVDMVSNVSSPAKLTKGSTWNATTGGEYLLNFIFGKNLSMRGMQFYGQTTYTSNSNPVWPDQGVYFGSCNTVTVQNNGFFNFGNGALRVTTDNRDPIRGVNSFNTVVSNNLFNNIYQISTTSNDDVHGATANYTLQSNTFYNLRGSVKFASRTPGAKNVKLLGNKINGGDHFGFEINNYSDFEISGNTLQNLKEFAVNVYNNPRSDSSFNWGDNFKIMNNTISSVGRCIRFSSEPYADGTPVTPHTVSISNNIINGVTNTDLSPAISQVNGKVVGLTISGNKMSNIANKKYIGYNSGSSITSYLNNLVNGVAYGPQQATASK